MGLRYDQHSDLCGCDRCARQWETDSPRPVFDAVEDPDILDCGRHALDRCRCDDFDPGDYLGD